MKVMAYLIFFTTAVCLIQVGFSQVTPDPDCKENSSPGGVDFCRQACDSQNVCTPLGTDGCACDDGYIALKQRDPLSACVKPEDCPKENCNRNSTVGGVDLCRKACDSQQVCAPVGTEGCACNSGYIAIKQRDIYSPCVKRHDCPNQCKHNEVYYEGGKPCGDRPCATMHLPCYSDVSYPPGCYCKDGFARNHERKCVKCPISNRCGRNEVYKKYGRPCPIKTCANRHQPPQICLSQIAYLSGCYCKRGYIRNDDNKCVRPRKCPKNECPTGEKYSSCGSACPLTCDNRQDAPFCIEECKKGCFCQDGQVRNDDGVCVDPDDCPDATCPDNQHSTTCGSYCQPYCANPKLEGVSCIESCYVGCVCDDGYIRLENDNGQCVKQSDCPV